MTTNSRLGYNSRLYGNNFESKKKVPQYAYSPPESELTLMEKMKQEWLKNNEVKVLN
jgi:hypothetical protein